jgi:hypothetical protein
LGRFGTAFAWLKIGGFLLLQFSLGVLLMGLAWTLKSRPETSQPVPASAATPRHTG